MEGRCCQKDDNIASFDASYGSNYNPESGWSANRLVRTRMMLSPRDLLMLEDRNVWSHPGHRRKETIMQRHPGLRTSQYQIFADCHQIWLEDDRADMGSGADPAERVAAIDELVEQLLSQEAHARRVGIAPGVMCLLTARARRVPIEVTLLAQSPAAAEAGWDRVVEASLDLPSGRMVVHGPSDYFPEAPRLRLSPGTYRVRAYFGGQDTVSPDESEGADHYWVVLWPAPTTAPAVLFIKEPDV